MDGRYRRRFRPLTRWGLCLLALCVYSGLLEGCRGRERRRGGGATTRSTEEETPGQSPRDRLAGRSSADRDLGPGPGEVGDEGRLDGDDGRGLAGGRDLGGPGRGFERSRPVEVDRDLAQGPMTPEKLIRILGMNSAARREASGRMVDLAEEDRLNLDNLKAEEKLEIALRLDPDNQDAERLLALVQLELGDRRGEISTIERTISEELKAQKDQLVAEVNLMLAKGRRYDEGEEYSKAIEQYERAVEVIRHNPLNLNLDRELRDAQQHLNVSREQKRTKDQAERRELERQLAENARMERETSLEYLKNRLIELRRKTREAFERQDFDLAGQNAGLILEIYPEDREAKQWKRVALEEWHIQTRQRLFQESVENYRMALQGIHESSVLYHEIFRFPPRKEWERLRPKQVTIADIVSESETAVEKEIKRKLQLAQDIAFPADTPFEEAIRTLRAMSGLNIVLNKEAREAIDDTTTIQLARVRDVPLENVLNLVLGQAEDLNFAFSIQEGAIVIGPRESLIAQNLFLYFYDVNDIVQSHPDFPAPELALESLEGEDEGGGGFGEDAFGDDEDTSGKPTTETLITLIEKELTDKETEEQIGTVNEQRGKLAVRTTLENHTKVEALLTKLRQATGMMVTVEARFLGLQDNFLEEIGVNMGSGNTTFLPNTIPDIDGSGTSLAPGYEYTNAQGDLNVRGATLGDFSNPLGSRVNPFNVTSSGGGAYQLNVLTDSYQLEAILTGVAKDQELRNLNSPRVTAFNTQIAHTMVINQAAYIKDLEVNQTGVVPVINPRIGVLNTGSILEVRPNISYDRKYIVLEIQPTLAEALDSEFAILNLSGAFTVVPVELPVTSVTQIKTTVTIPDGGTVLLGGLKREIRSKQSVGIPGLRHIPIINLLWGRKGVSTLRANLFVLINAKITIVQEEEERLFNI